MGTHMAATAARHRLRRVLLAVLLLVGLVGMHGLTAHHDVVGMSMASASSLHHDGASAGEPGVTPPTAPHLAGSSELAVIGSIASAAPGRKAAASADGAMAGHLGGACVAILVAALLFTRLSGNSLCATPTAAAATAGAIRATATGLRRQPSLWQLCVLRT